MVDAGQPPGQELHINSEKSEKSASLPVYPPLLSNLPRATYVTSTTEVPVGADSNGDVEHPLIPTAESSHFVSSTFPWLFKKPKRHLIIFVIQTITEMIISSVPIIVIIHPEDIGWILLFFSHLICGIVILTTSLLLCPQKWMLHYFKFDTLMFYSIGAIITAGLYFSLSAPGDSRWRIPETVVQSILIVILSGAFRVMLKHYPWARISIFIYKLNRGYGFLVFIAIQLVQTYSDLGSGETTAEELAGQSLWIVIIVTYRTEMLTMVVQTEAELTKRLRKKKASTVVDV